MQQDLKYQYISIRLCGSTSQKTVVFILIFLLVNHEGKNNLDINVFIHTGYLQPFHQEPVQLYDTPGYRCDFHKPTVDHICADMMLDLQHSRASHMSHDLRGTLLQLAPSYTNSHCIRKLKCLKCSVQSL
jgi:hypothetical protein